MNNFGNISQQQLQEKAAYARGDYANAACPPERPMSIIDAQLQMLGERIEVLLHQVENLESRLSSVLRQEAKTPQTSGKLSGSTGVSLGDRLNGQAARIQEAIDRLNSMQERIEL